MYKKLLLIILTAFCINASYADEQSKNTDTAEENIALNHIKDLDDEASDAKESNEAEEMSPYEDIIKKCKEEAARETKKKYNEFDLTNYTQTQIKFWYYTFLIDFNSEKNKHLENKVKSGLITLKEHAFIAHKVRNYADTFIQSSSEDKKNSEKHNNDSSNLEQLMEDQIDKQTAEFVKENPHKTFNTKPTKDGGDFDADKAYKTIIKISTNIPMAASFFVNCHYLISTKICVPIGGLLSTFNFLDI